ncbi:hypothetical protein DAPPUDRAFT_277564 [Daphnia pulex]|uniref:Uncharacterized protein n=1 Tax=Daphnia pulex TaxID=6669 RepID=E9I6F7_DAPPU|nr:hypothetical protein DAPPUDRAFT_277564 [Daphnia pulex]|eukprot:EFX60423.1 hypothetical protein DAPPUDRAFT_277564 [Daphnia pulex]
MNGRSKRYLRATSRLRPLGHGRQSDVQISNGHPGDGLCYLGMGAKIRSRSVTDSDIDSPSLFHVRKEKSNGRSVNIVELHTDAEGQLLDLGAINAALTNGFCCNVSHFS